MSGATLSFSRGVIIVSSRQGTNWGAALLNPYEVAARAETSKTVVEKGVQIEYLLCKVEFRPRSSATAAACGRRFEIARSAADCRRQR